MRTDRCTAQRRDGSFCDHPSVEDAPFPICQKHLRQVINWHSEATSSAPRSMLVYYAMTEQGHVKIGTTSQRVPDRLGAQGLKAADLLAVEPGGFVLEGELHRRFRPARVPGMGREIFYATPELLAHAARVAQQHGLPVLDFKHPAIVEYLPAGPVHPGGGTRRGTQEAMRQFMRGPRQPEAGKVQDPPIGPEQRPSRDRDPSP